MDEDEKEVEKFLPEWYLQVKKKMKEKSELGKNKETSTK